MGERGEVQELVDWPFRSAGRYANGIVQGFILGLAIYHAIATWPVTWPLG
jgi:hypothetical protein